MITGRTYSSKTESYDSFLLSIKDQAPVPEPEPEPKPKPEPEPEPEPERQPISGFPFSSIIIVFLLGLIVWQISKEQILTP